MIEEANPEKGFLGQDLEKGDTMVYQEQKEHCNTTAV